MNPSLVAEANALSKGAEFLDKPAIQFGENYGGYEYKRWIPLWIPFIQYSTDIWAEVNTTPDTFNSAGANWQGGASHVPFNQFVRAGTAYDFQIFTPKDHPFLLIDIKVSAELQTTRGVGPAVTSLGSRFSGPYAPASPLYRKYLYPGNEGIVTSLTAVSPSGKPIWGGLQNVTGMDNMIRTIGPVPHTERVHLPNAQYGGSGRGALPHYILFPVEGVIRITVENQNLDLSTNPALPDGAFVNGAVFGYVIME